MNGSITSEQRNHSCEMCDGQAYLTVERVPFLYGEGDQAVRLEAEMPVWKCDDCDEVFTAEGAEEAERDAIWHHLGRLAPDEIVAVRKSLGLTQDELAKVLKVGRITVVRWEGGQQMPSEVFSDRLREIRDTRCFQNQNRKFAEPRFRTPVEHRRPAAAAFSLMAAA